VLCNICNQSEASIHLTEIVENKIVELHLCEQCAQEKGMDVKTTFNFSDLLAGLAELTPQVAAGKQPALVCRTCGLRYDEFGKIGRLGCADCYKTFASALLPLIKRVQQATQHAGKRPERAPRPAAPAAAASPLERLQERLKQAVESEAFEEAARLRDEIHLLEERERRSSRKSTRAKGEAEA